LSHATVARVAFLKPLPGSLCCHVVVELEKQMWERRMCLRPNDMANRMIVRDTYLKACQALDLPPLPHVLDPAPPHNWPRERVCIILCDGCTDDSYLVNMLSGLRRFVPISSIAQVVVTRCNDDWFQVHKTRPPRVYPMGRKFNAHSINRAILDGFMNCSPFEANVTYTFALLKHN